jgi:hypothetical protein
LFTQLSTCSSDPQMVFHVIIALKELISVPLLSLYRISCMENNEHGKFHGDEEILLAIVLNNETNFSVCSWVVGQLSFGNSRKSGV